MDSPKRILFSVAALMLIIFPMLILSAGCPALAAGAFELEPEELKFVETTDREEVIELINMCQSRKDNAHTMAEAARALGYDENHPVIQLAKKEWASANLMQSRYQEQLTQYPSPTPVPTPTPTPMPTPVPTPNKWDQFYAEYPIATEIWVYLKDLGYNDYVCAGIMGNIMAECGGQTLNIQHTLYSSGGGYYGMCQWSKRYYPQVHGTDLKTQCNFLRDTIKKEIDMFGYKYSRGFNYESFLNLKNERSAALAFAKAYERCGSGSYSVRQKNATTAYNYFVD